MWLSMLRSFRGQGLLFSHRWTGLLSLFPISLGAILLYQQRQLELALLVLLQVLQLLREFVGRGKKLKLALRNERCAEKKELVLLRELDAQRKNVLMLAQDIVDTSEFHSPQLVGKKLISWSRKK